MRPTEGKIQEIDIQSLKNFEAINKNTSEVSEMRKDIADLKVELTTG